MRTLLIGFGRAGSGLHWGVLRRLRGEADSRRLFATDPPVVLDSGQARAAAAREGLTVVGSLAQAAARLDPQDTVVHLCAPPTTRVSLLREVAAQGFRQILVEKPLAAGAADVREIVRLHRAEGLRIVTVAQWLCSALTQRLTQLVAGGDLGTLSAISLVQRKPRIMRTLVDAGHPTAFDVELPHSVGVALRLAGDAEVAEAGCSDLRVGGIVVPRMGTAQLVLDHPRGPVTQIMSDLTSPVRERRVELTFSAGRVVGHYPVSSEDHYATLSVSAGDRRTDETLFDDSMSTFFAQTYRRFLAGDDFGDDFAAAVRVVELLAAAKRRSAPGAGERVLPAAAAVATAAAGPVRASAAAPAQAAAVAVPVGATAAEGIRGDG